MMLKKKRAPFVLREKALARDRKARIDSLARACVSRFFDVYSFFTRCLVFRIILFQRKKNRHTSLARHVDPRGRS